MEKGMKQNIILLIIVVVMLLFNIIYTVLQSIDYEKRKESGNERWFEIQNMILENKKQIDNLKGEIENVRGYNKDCVKPRCLYNSFNSHYNSTKKGSSTMA